MKPIAFWLPVLIVGLFLFSDLSSAQEPCEFIGSVRNNPNSPKLKSLGAEHLLGSICDPSSLNVCSHDDISPSRVYEMGISKEDEKLNELLDSGFIVWISKVDIDNDGFDEIRIFSSVGTARCMRSYFYRKDKTTGKFLPITDKSYDILSQEGRFCDGKLSFIRYQDKVYALESYATIDTVWSGSKSELSKKCSYNSHN